MLNKEELFLEGHKELTNLVRWISSPIFYAQKGTFEPRNVNQMYESGTIVFGNNKVGDSIETVFKLPNEDISLILKTFCASHQQLNERKETTKS